MGDSALCASLKSGKRLIISIICTICCGVKKTLIFFYKTVEFCLCVHILVLHYFSIFLEYIGSKENDYIHTLLLELLIFYKVDFFCNQYP